MPAAGREAIRESLRDRLRAAARLEFPHPHRPVFEGRPAGVLLLVGLDAGDRPRLLITRRTEHLATHKSQYALPGGAQDPGDVSIEATALRETEEEMGVAPAEVETLGGLPALWTPSGFRITPVLGLLRQPIPDVAIRPNPEEIDHWFWCGLEELRRPGVHSQETREIRHGERTYAVSVDVFQVADHRIWGATGAILKNFIDRLERVDGLG